MLYPAVSTTNFIKLFATLHKETAIKNNNGSYLQKACMSLLHFLRILHIFNATKKKNEMPKRRGKKKTAKNEENRTRVENAANEKSTRQHCLLASAYWYFFKIFFSKYLRV